MRSLRERTYLVVVALAVAGCAPSHQRNSVGVCSSVVATSVEPYADEIAKFAAADRVALPPAREVLFVGSSTIRIWPALASDFAGVPVIQRGLGGSELSDIVHYASRIVIPYKPRLIVLYAGDNDLAAGKKPETVFCEYKEFVHVVESALPDTRIAFVSIKPSLARWALVDRVRSTNSMISNFAGQDRRLLYIDVFTSMLGADGKPRKELFVEDGLHMNGAGYSIWRDILNPIVRAGAH
jgi:lysophospholipase L1-like esterase